MTQEPLQLSLRNDEGAVVGKLLLSNLPGRQDTMPSARGDAALREAAIYRYQIRSDAINVDVEPSELFDPDDACRKHGRLRPGQAVGRLRIQVVDRTTGQTGTTDVDVIAVK